MKWLLVVLALVIGGSSVAGADEDPLIQEIQRYNYKTKALTGENISVFRLADGYVTQEPQWLAYFEHYLNPVFVPPGRSQAQALYAQALESCLAPRIPSLGLSPQEEVDIAVQLRAFLEYWVLLLSEVPPVAVYPGGSAGTPDASSCTDFLGANVIAQTEFGKLVNQAVFFGLEPFKAAAVSFFRSRACGTGPVAFEDLASIFFFRSSFGRLLHSEQLSIGLNPTSETPDAIFRCKTTPWLYSRQKAFTGELPTWNELGMNEYYTWGFTSVHSWIAQQRFYDTWWGTLMDFTPVLGGVLAAGDSAIDFYEGRDIHGNVARSQSGLMFSVNYAFTVTDVFGLRGLTMGGVTQLKKLRATARKAVSQETLVQVLNKTKAVFRTVPSVGENLAKFRNLYGTALRSDEFWKAFASGWRTFSMDRRTLMQATKRFGAGMTLFLKGGFTREGVRIQGAQEMCRSLMRRGGDARAVFAQVREKIETGIAFSTKRSASTTHTDDHILNTLDDTVYGKPKETMNGASYPVLDMPDEMVEDIRKAVEGPGHKVSYEMDGTKHLSRTIEIEIDGEKFAVKNITMPAENPKAGQITYWANDAARTAVEKRMEDLFVEAMKRDPVTGRLVSVERATEIGIELEWLINQIVPYKGGSSSIGQAWKHVILESRGVTLGQIKDGIGFDVKSWIRSLDDYIVEHPSYYRKSDEVLDGVAHPIPAATLSPSHAPPVSLGAAESDWGTALNIKHSLVALGTSGGVRQFAGWFAGDLKFADPESGEAPDFASMTGLPPVLQNPQTISIEAYELDAQGEVLDPSSPIARATLSDPPEGFDSATYEHWRKPGFVLEVPTTYAEDAFGIWAVWTGTSQRKKLNHKNDCLKYMYSVAHPAPPGIDDMTPAEFLALPETTPGLVDNAAYVLFAFHQNSDFWQFGPSQEALLQMAWIQIHAYSPSAGVSDGPVHSRETTWFESEGLPPPYHANWIAWNMAPGGMVAAVGRHGPIFEPEPGYGPQYYVQYKLGYHKTHKDLILVHPVCEYMSEAGLAERYTEINVCAESPPPWSPHGGCLVVYE